MKSKTKQKQVVKQKINLSMGDSPYLNNAASDPKSKQSANTQGKVKKAKSARKPKPKSKAKKMKQKQEVKQNVKVNVQASGGSGSGGSSIPTVPQYIPPQYIPNVPAHFQDRRGEDVILQKLSEVVDKFNSKPQPIQELPKVNPQPNDYIDGPEDAEFQVANINSNRNLFPQRDASNDPILKRIEGAERFLTNEFFSQRKSSEETLKRLQALESQQYLNAQNLQLEAPAVVAKSKKLTKARRSEIAKQTWEKRKAAEAQAKIEADAQQGGNQDPDEATLLNFEGNA